MSKKCCKLCEHWVFEDFIHIEKDLYDFLGYCELWDEYTFDSQVCDKFADIFPEELLTPKFNCDKIIK